MFLKFDPKKNYNILNQIILRLFNLEVNKSSGSFIRKYTLQSLFIGNRLKKQKVRI